MKKIVLAVAVAGTAIISNGDIGKSASEYIAPSPETDFKNFIHFVWARSICTAFEVDYHRAMMEIMVLGETMGLTEAETLGKVGLESEQAMLSYQDDAYAYCTNLREILRTYDSDRLLDAGIAPGRFP